MTILRLRRARWRGQARRRPKRPPLALLIALGLAVPGFAATMLTAPNGAPLIETLVRRVSTTATAPDLLGVARVRDGDTIVVAGTPVRLNGLHCPEAREPGGRAATEAMEALVARAVVACDLTGKRTYDREVGRCSVGRTDLGERLIRAGYCARCPRYDPAGRYSAAQRAAGAWPAALPGYCR